MVYKPAPSMSPRSVITSRPLLIGQAFQAAMNINSQRALMYDLEGNVMHANPLLITYEFAGISLQAALAGHRVDTCTHGRLSDPAWEWLPGGAIFVAPDGKLTQDVPIEGILHRVALAATATVIVVHSSTDVLLA